MIAATLLCFGVCGGYSMLSVQRELSYCNDAALDMFCTGLQYTVEDLENFNRSIYSSESVFSLLSTQSISGSVEQRMMAEWNLRELCRSRTTASTGIYIFQSGENGFRFYHFGDDFLGSVITPETTRLTAHIRDYWETQEPPAFQRWTLLREGDTALLMNVVRRNDLYACSMIDLNAYTRNYQAEDTASGIRYVFFNDDDVLTNVDYMAEEKLRLEDLRQAGSGDRGGLAHSLILQTRWLDALEVGLCGMISVEGIWASLRLYAVLLFATLLIISGIFTAIYLLMRRMLIYPLDQISEASRQIAAGATEIDPQPESIQELDAIQRALRGLVEQKVSLERESISQVYQKEHAMLQYYQLQTRSHFFLNCLKSIYNMASRGELEKTLRVITLFSNHLRFVFHDGLSLIPVRAELSEVDDYFHIIELERSDHILLTREIDSALMDYPVPPLVIQTFLENFNKHNAQGERILRFVIHIDRVDMEDLSYVRIRLSDNGVGYDKDALKDIGRRDELFSQYHVGVQNLLRRLDILYQGRHQIAFYNNPGGGASSVIYLPLDGAGNAQDKTKESEPA